MQPYSSIDVTAAWKKLRFILSVRTDFHIIDSLLIAVHAFVNLMSFSVDVSAHKTEYMCYNQTGDKSTLDGTPLKQL